jgi:hypothetical protein
MRVENYFQNFPEYRPNGLAQHRPNGDNDSRQAHTPNTGDENDRTPISNRAANG